MRMSWSWTALKNWRDCPKRYYHLNLVRDIKEPETEALKAGNVVHKLMEMRVRDGTILPIAYQRYERWTGLFDKLKAAGYTVTVEEKLAFDDAFMPLEYKHKAAWYRCKVDVLAVAPNGKSAIAYDWKTGKVLVESQQLALNAQAVMVHHPEIEKVSTAYIWLREDARSIEEYDQKALTGMWAGLWPELKQFEDAHKTTTFPAKPGGLCREWCPVKSCPHHGVGSY